MNWIPQLSNGLLAVAGLVFATGPLLIHLLNRRRFRTVDWAAMDFLYEALQQQKRNLRLRDWLLLIVRTAAVLLFGLALARPYFANSQSSISANDPRHLILLVDNSLSMGYRQLDKTRLERAKEEAAQLIESLADGSQVTVLRLCGIDNGRSGPQRRKSDAQEMLQSIRLADTMARIEDTIALAQSVIGTAKPLPDQIVLLTDLQSAGWPQDLATEQLEKLVPLQIRDFSDRNWQNAWIAELQLSENVLDLHTEATAYVTVCHRGSEARRVSVTLTLNNTVVATRSVEFPPGLAERRLAFEYSFADAQGGSTVIPRATGASAPDLAAFGRSDPAIQPGLSDVAIQVATGDVAFVSLEASLAPDRLPQDDRLAIMVPVVAELPAVFIDQFADSEENASLGRLGETRPLRYLLAPLTKEAGSLALVDIRHVTLGQVNRSVLAPARLVVVAGVADPGPTAELLEEYVRQGGCLIIAAGGDFDPVAWNLTTGPAASGLLPGTFQVEPIGVAPNEIGDQVLQPFRLATDDLNTIPLLRLPALSDEELTEIYREPLFFKAFDLQLASGATQLSPAPTQTLSRDPTALSWLAWQPPHRPQTSNENAAASVYSGSHAVQCLRFDNSSAAPFLVSHRLGQGTIICCTTSLLPTWNSLAQTNAVILWDHIARQLISETIPQRNFEPQQQIALSLPPARHGNLVQLQRPGEQRTSETLEVGFIDKNRRGISVPQVWSRGLYQVPRPWDADSGVIPAERWRLDFAVRGPADESNLMSLSEEDIQQRIVATGLGKTFVGDTLNNVQQLDHGHAFWWYLVVAVMLLLVAEMTVLLLSFRQQASGASG